MAPNTVATCPVEECLRCQSRRWLGRRAYRPPGPLATCTRPVLLWIAMSPRWRWGVSGVGGGARTTWPRTASWRTGATARRAATGGEQGQHGGGVRVSIPSERTAKLLPRSDDMSEILAWAGQHGQGGASGQFVRKELVGKGAYGGVYKGIHTPTGLVVALKVIDLDTPDDDIHDIQTEVALLSSIPHARKHNITLYHGSYLHGSELWIAMDFASGGSIRTLMKSGTIEEKYVVLILREVLVALSFLHKQGIIHRDVKAANVLLTQSGKILLCDFGVAAHLQTNNKRSTFIGTPLWMAPEVITDGKLYDTKADIWSLGVTLYEIATGNPPYFGMEPLRACALIPRSQPAKLEGGTWSISMREFLSLCLQTDPANVGLSHSTGP